MAKTSAQKNTPQKNTSNLPAPLQERNIDQLAWNTLKNSIFPGALDESILLAFDYCQARNLDVMKKPVHIVPMMVTIKSQDGNYKNDKQIWRDVIMPGIYELRATASRTGQYAGQDEPVFGPTVSIENVNSSIQAPEWCKVTVYKFVQNVKVPFTHTEFFEEAVARKKDGSINSMWSKRKRGQLAKCAEAGALRKAFPEEIGGEMAAEEMHGKMIDMGDAERTDNTADLMPKAIETNTTSAAQPSAATVATKTVQTPAPPASLPPTANAGALDGPKINDGQKRVIYAQLNAKGLTEQIIIDQFAVDSLDMIPLAKINDVLTWIRSHA